MKQPQHILTNANMLSFFIYSIRCNHTLFHPIHCSILSCKDAVHETAASYLNKCKYAVAFLYKTIFFIKFPNYVISTIHHYKSSIHVDVHPSMSIHHPSCRSIHQNVIYCSIRTITTHRPVSTLSMSFVHCSCVSQDHFL
jgi:hypothetical protein